MLAVIPKAEPAFSDCGTALVVNLHRNRFIGCPNGVLNRAHRTELR
jgi:hypothetical protein